MVIVTMEVAETTTTTAGAVEMGEMLALLFSRLVDVSLTWMSIYRNIH